MASNCFNSSEASDQSASINVPTLHQLGLHLEGHPMAVNQDEPSPSSNLSPSSSSSSSSSSSQQLPPGAEGSLATASSSSSSSSMSYSSSSSSSSYSSPPPPQQQLHPQPHQYTTHQAPTLTIGQAPVVLVAAAAANPTTPRCTGPVEVAPQPSSIPGFYPPAFRHKLLNDAQLIRNRRTNVGASLRADLELTCEDKVSRYNIEAAHCSLASSNKSTFIMTFSPDGQRVASTHGDHRIYICDLNTGKLLDTLGGHPKTPWCLAWHPSNRDILASGCLAGEVRVWDLRSKTCELWTSDNNTIITSMDFHPKERLLVVATANDIHFWDWSKSEPFAKTTTTHDKEKVKFVEFDSSGTKLITGISNLLRFAGYTNESLQNRIIDSYLTQGTLDHLQQTDNMTNTSETTELSSSASPATVSKRKDSESTTSTTPRTHNAEDKKRRKIVHDGHQHSPTNTAIQPNSPPIVTPATTKQQQQQQPSSPQQSIGNPLNRNSNTPLLSHQIPSSTLTATAYNPAQAASLPPQNQTMSSSSSELSTHNENMIRGGYSGHRSSNNNTTNNNINTNNGAAILNNQAFEQILPRFLVAASAAPLGSSHVLVRIYHRHFLGTQNAPHTAFAEVSLGDRLHNPPIEVRRRALSHDNFAPSIDGEQAAAGGVTRGDHGRMAHILPASEANGPTEFWHRHPHLHLYPVRGSGQHLWFNHLPIPLSVSNSNYRLQCWNFSLSALPNIKDSQSNIITQRCRIHNDASIDISKNGSLIACLVPRDDGACLPSFDLKIFSIRLNDFGTCYYKLPHGPNAISVSLSPSSSYVVVGLASNKVFSNDSNDDDLTIAKVFKLNGINSFTYVRDIKIKRDDSTLSLNAIRWMARGIVYNVGPQYHGRYQPPRIRNRVA